MTTPDRPTAVPAGAVFEPESALWGLYEHDGAGARHGAFSTFRADGVLITRGSYRAGKLDGALSRFTSGAPGAPTLRACCVPGAARELRTTYRQGRVLHEVFYDEGGRPLCDDGTPWPERPASVPEEAIFDDLSAHFVLRLERDGGGHTVRYFNVDGWLEEEFDARGAEREARRRYAPDGTRTEETGLIGERQPHFTYAPHGTYVARVAAGTAPYADTRIREVRGQHDHGEPIGEWELRDAEGDVIRRVAMGERLVASSLTLVSGAHAPRVDAARSWSLAESPERSPREALAHAARALARSGDTARFERFLAGRCIVLAPELARARGEDAVLAKDASPSSLLGAALAGASIAVVLRRLSSVLTGDAPASIDYLDASLRLWPEQDMTALARGLLCVEHGDPEGALAAAETLTGASAEAATLLRDFCRITYASPDFRPDAEGVTVPDEELVELAPVQSLEAVQRAVALYATRLALTAEELTRRGLTPPWPTATTSKLMPDGPVELRRFTARIEDEGENGPEVSEAEVDESIEQGASTRTLLHRARADWAALGWLCWSVGLDRIALPESVNPPATWVAAMHQATLRCWRAQDRIRTKGLVALARRVPGFRWEGMAIDDVPAHLAELVAAEYLEVRAQFLWLLYEQNQSPFQSDLRVV